MVAKPNNTFSKTMTLTKSDGETITLEGTAAMAMQKRLEDNPNYTRTVDRTGKITFLNVNPSACGICEVATVKPSGRRVEPEECEDKLGCPDV